MALESNPCEGGGDLLNLCAVGEGLLNESVVNECSRQSTAACVNLIWLLFSSDHCAVIHCDHCL